MSGATKSIGLIRRAMWPALALIVVGNFATYAIAGPNGRLAWGGYARTLAERKADPDLGEEMIRSQLGLIRSDEVIVPLN